MISLNLRTTDVLEEVNDLRSLIDSLQVPRFRVFLPNHEDAWSFIWKRSCGAFCACGQAEIMLCLCLLFSFTFLSRFAFEWFPFAFALGGVLLVLFVLDFPFAFSLCLIFPLPLPLFLFTELCRHTIFNSFVEFLRRRFNLFHELLWSSILLMLPMMLPGMFASWLPSPHVSLVLSVLRCRPVF